MMVTVAGSWIDRPSWHFFTGSMSGLARQEGGHCFPPHVRARCVKYVGLEG